MSAPSVLSRLLAIVTLSLLSTASLMAEPAQKTYYVYLAGPEVFLPEPIKAGDSKKAIITQLNKKHKWPFTLVGLYPMDNEITDFKPDRRTGIAIYEANIALMDKADYIAANMVRFRGPSMDVGTAFEMGYMRGLNKPVFAYYESKPFYGVDEEPGTYSERVRKHYRVDRRMNGLDIHGQSIEEFQMADNLMMIGALNDTGETIQPSFEESILAIAKHIRESNK